MIKNCLKIIKLIFSVYSTGNDNYDKVDNQNNSSDSDRENSKMINICILQRIQVSNFLFNIIYLYLYRRINE